MVRGLGAVQSLGQTQLKYVILSRTELSVGAAAVHRSVTIR
jgi:hypothetical protein